MALAPQKIVPVILSGGSGTRLWPMSRGAYPKQFLPVVDHSRPMIQETLQRVSNSSLFHAPIVVGNVSQRFLLAEHMRQCGIAEPDILIEPDARNTAPAIAAAALHVQEQYGNALMLVLPTDHVVGNQEAFLEGIKRAAETAAKGFLVTFGIQPDHAETGYGYIRRGKPLPGSAGIFEIAAFVEKPDVKTAENFLATKEYFWNSGMFLFPTELLLQEMAQWQPDILSACRQAVAGSKKDLDFTRLEEVSFSHAPNISIDYAIMEQTTHAAVVALDCGWSDTGAWDLLWNITPKDADGNAVLGESYAFESRNCYVRSAHDGPAVVTYGVDNLVVIATKDAVLVTTKEKSQSLKETVAQVKQHNPKLVHEHHRVFRPWGAYESIQEGPRYQVKRLIVKPGEKLSLQMHYHRAEHWIVVSGTGNMTCGDITRAVTENESFYVPCGTIHCIENPGKIDLEIIEVQSGTYLGEDDIVRFEDRYGRQSLATIK